ncbi:MAG: Zn-ribbon domain-containing OB-fold protein [Anaerolineae bacterium]|nr:Zn-ribbon domain-containing OB-fold protein [Anaerolineae bacterium]
MSQPAQDPQTIEVKQPYISGGKGTVLSYTIVTDAPEGFEEQAPYTLGLVKLDEGPTVLAQLTDLEATASIGMRVEMVTRKLRTDGKRGIIVYGYKFRPLLRDE